MKVIIAERLACGVVRTDARTNGNYYIDALGNLAKRRQTPKIRLLIKSNLGRSKGTVNSNYEATLYRNYFTEKSSEAESGDTTPSAVRALAIMW